MKTCLRAGLYSLAAMTSFAPQSRAESLSVTKSPPGANVEIKGVLVGTTPFPPNIPGGYLHQTHVVFSTRLDHFLLKSDHFELKLEAAGLTNNETWLGNE
jgi:hypothetical protein